MRKAPRSSVTVTYGLLAGRTVFNLALPVKDQAVDISKRLSKPGVVRVLCDAHPHMFAWMVVHDSPYVTVTDERGAFRIDQVPPGAYTVTMWHEGFRQTGADKDGRPIYDEPRTVTKNVTIPRPPSSGGPPPAPRRARRRSRPSIAAWKSRGAHTSTPIRNRSGIRSMSA